MLLNLRAGPYLTMLYPCDATISLKTITSKIPQDLSFACQYMYSWQSIPCSTIQYVSSPLYYMWSSDLFTNLECSLNMCVFVAEICYCYPDYPMRNTETAWLLANMQWFLSFMCMGLDTASMIWSESLRASPYEKHHLICIPCIDRKNWLILLFCVGTNSAIHVDL